MSMLEQILTDMLYDTQALKQRPVTRKLKNGLHITVFNDRSAIILTLSREKVYPSSEEWFTVLNHWPYYVQKNILPDRIVTEHRMALRARLPVPSSEQIKMFDLADHG